MFIQRLLLSLTTASSSSSSSFSPSTSSFSFSSSCSAPRRRTQHRKTDTRQAEDTSGRGKVNREKFLARRVTVGLVACFFFFDPCHATLLSSRLPSRAEGIFRFIHRWTPDRSGKLLYRKQPSSVASHSLCALHPSEYHSANVDLHPFSTSSEGTTCPPDETFRTFFFFATSVSRLVQANVRSLIHL